MAIFIFFSVRQCKENKEVIKIYRKSYDSTVNTTRLFKNKLGEYVSRGTTYELTIEQLKKEGGNLSLESDKLKKKVVNLNNLVAHWKGKASLHDTIVVENTDTLFIINTDTLKVKHFKWNNNYLSVDGLTTPKFTTLVYDYRFDFDLTSYYKREGIFKRKELVTDIHFSDTNLVTQDFKGVVVKKPRPRWYESRGFAIGVGIIGGLLLAK